MYLRKSKKAILSKKIVFININIEIKNTLSGIFGISQRGVPQYSANSRKTVRECR